MPIGVAFTTTSAAATAASRSVQATYGACASAAASSAAPVRAGSDGHGDAGVGEREHHRPGRAPPRTEDEHLGAGGFILGSAQRSDEALAVGGVAVERPSACRVTRVHAAERGGVRR